MQDLLLNRGWEKLGPQSYRHYCGAAVWRRGAQNWTVKTADGHLRKGFSTAEEAAQWIERNTPTFWTLGRNITWGFLGDSDIEYGTGYLHEPNGDHVIAISIPSIGSFPPNLRKIFQKRFISRASCAKCGGRPSEVNLRPLFKHGHRAKRRVLYIVCDCGYPVWRVPRSVCSDLENRIANGLFAQHRKEIRAIAGGGNHTDGDIRQILSLQENRCIYCNVLFTEKKMPTRDHIKPVSKGGMDWALNIVMACGSCNSSRSATPFCAYCKRLSPAQNRRILQNLGRRIDALGTDYVQLGAMNEVARIKQIRFRLSKEGPGSQSKKTAGKKHAVEKGCSSVGAVRQDGKRASQSKQRLTDTLELT